VKDAKVSVVNTATGAAREVMSGSDGLATIPALSLTGTYTVSVSKEGFNNQELKGITLRSSETATLKVKLLVGSTTAEVAIFSTVDGVRADPQIGRRLDSSQIDDTAAPEFRFPARKRNGRSFRQRNLLHYWGGITPHHDVYARRRQQ
jgi:hypothetical protein